MERRCLIIDPSSMVRRVAARIIRELGLDALDAKTGQEGLDVCADRMPDAIMIDWTLPDMQADQFLNELDGILARSNGVRPSRK
ncbi:MAG: response regulator [Pseudomonadota bacterium]